MKKTFKVKDGSRPERVLQKMDLTEVSFVGQGANPLANILLTKNRTLTKDISMNPTPSTSPAPLSPWGSPEGKALLKAFDNFKAINAVPTPDQSPQEAKEPILKLFSAPSDDTDKEAVPSEVPNEEQTQDGDSSLEKGYSKEQILKQKTDEKRIDTLEHQALIEKKKLKVASKQVETLQKSLLRANILAKKKEMQETLQKSFPNLLSSEDMPDLANVCYILNEHGSEQDQACMATLLAKTSALSKTLTSEIGHGENNQENSTDDHFILSKAYKAASDSNLTVQESLLAMQTDSNRKD